MSTSKKDKIEIIEDLRNIGIVEGDTVFLRISYRSIGKLDGGPQTFIDAILDVLGPNGTIVATAFYKRYHTFFRLFHVNKIYKRTSPPPPVVGIIPALMEKHPKSKLSKQPIYPFVAIGKYAKELTDNHQINSEPYDLIKDLAENYSAKCLRIGGRKFVGTTHVAFTESLVASRKHQIKASTGYYAYDTNNKKRWFKATSSTFCPNGYEAFFTQHIKQSVLSVNNIGNGDAMLTSMNETLKLERKYISDSPEILLCNNPNCFSCNYSYSYSISKSKFIIRQLKNLSGTKRDRKTSLRNIGMVIYIRLLGTKRN